MITCFVPKKRKLDSKPRKCKIVVTYTCKHDNLIHGGTFVEVPNKGYLILNEIIKNSNAQEVNPIIWKARGHWERRADQWRINITF